MARTMMRYVVNESAEKAKQSFQQQFWYAEGNYLYDNIDANGKPSTEFRPNQLFAISLPYALIEGQQANAVLQKVDGTIIYTCRSKEFAKE